MNNEHVRILTRQLQHLHKHIPHKQYGMSNFPVLMCNLSTYLKSDPKAPIIATTWAECFHIEMWEWNMNNPCSIISQLFNRDIHVLSLVYILLNHKNCAEYLDMIQWLLNGIANRLSIALPTDPAPTHYPEDDLRHPKYQSIVQFIREYCKNISNGGMLAACLMDHFRIDGAFCPTGIFGESVVDVLTSPYLLHHVSVSDIVNVVRHRVGFGYFRETMVRELGKLSSIKDGTTITTTVSNLSMTSRDNGSKPAVAPVGLSVLEILQQRPWVLPQLCSSQPSLQASSVSSPTTAAQVSQATESLIEETQKTSSSHEDKNKCIVCLDEERNICFLPCGHVCCCAKCAQDTIRTMAKKCPLCRAECTHTVRIYY